MKSQDLTQTYNGMTFTNIVNCLPKNMTPYHKELYMNNCYEVARHQANKANKELCESLKNSNNLLIKIYTNNI